MLHPPLLADTSTISILCLVGHRSLVPFARLSKEYCTASPRLGLAITSLCAHVSHMWQRYLPWRMFFGTAPAMHFTCCQTMHLSQLSVSTRSSTVAPQAQRTVPSSSSNGKLY
ncbi:hypothetical protein BAUCODRAFT_181768 [Baudoinia panamericana UAMH 10762]|uniref:Uncharacterized protein n=1 Tax=Baudoinia panamericana (strain UAMH 10762) TaxID=717646 RepID=M2NND8_BAUPA|nr:uncharacterized protein BAUCODRAFT_181768 [Baudoinia panamericana UAMH 10762]EMD00751.1 hypothetical protein BAUCODRAFT_181768 [Baudoinia panamericana UAMH 10762]